MKISVLVSIFVILQIYFSEAIPVPVKINSLDDDQISEKNTIESLEEENFKNYEIGQEYKPKIRRKRQTDEIFSDVSTFIDNVYRFDRICFEPTRGIKIQSRIPITSVENLEKLKIMFEELKNEYSRMMTDNS